MGIGFERCSFVLFADHPQVRSCLPRAKPKPSWLYMSFGQPLTAGTLTAQGKLNSNCRVLLPAPGGSQQASPPPEATAQSDLQVQAVCVSIATAERTVCRLFANSVECTGPRWCASIQPCPDPAVGAARIVHGYGLLGACLL